MPAKALQKYQLFRKRQKNLLKMIPKIFHPAAAHVLAHCRRHHNARHRQHKGQSFSPMPQIYFSRPAGPARFRTPLRGLAPNTQRQPL